MFKIGQWVRCIDAVGSGRKLTVGKIYQVSNVLMVCNTETIIIKHDGSISQFVAERFIVVEDKFNSFIKNICSK